jgi:hypothetical protein
MDTLLILAGIFALGAVMVGLHILVEARRRANQGKQRMSGAVADPTLERRSGERRVSGNVAFPIEVSGALIKRDRRIYPDRRLVA